MEIKILKQENCPEWVIDHSIAVYNKAIEISKNFNVDNDLIKKGSLLHDIGRSKTNDINHAIIGSKIAIKHGFSNEVANIIEKHIGSGITKKEAIDLGLPKKDYLPVTLEEKIVSHSDNLFNGSKEVDIEFVANKWKKRLANADDAIYRLKKMHNELVTPFIK
ncbi:MAG: TIGR00295 family protein [Methanobrevibacter sp.]|nr:TIGR00295 family protein [Methanobrevibacter sp.]